MLFSTATDSHPSGSVFFDLRLVVVFFLIVPGKFFLIVPDYLALILPRNFSFLGLSALLALHLVPVKLVKPLRALVVKYKGSDGKNKEIAKQSLAKTRLPENKGNFSTD